MNDTARALLDRLGIAPPPCGFSIGPGWLPIVERALIEMISAGWDRQLHQVKEKFGGLRLYIGQGNIEIEGIIRRAEDKAAITCEQCGAPGKERGDGWIRVLCENCAEKGK